MEKVTNSYYLDKVYDGRWKVISYSYHSHHPFFKLENIYNKETIEIDIRQIKKVDAGQDTICRILSRRIKEDSHDVFNSVKYYKYYYAKRARK